MFKVIKKHWSLIALLALSEIGSGILYIIPNSLLEGIGIVLLSMTSTALLIHTFNKCFPNIDFMDFAAGNILTFILFVTIKVVMALYAFAV